MCISDNSWISKLVYYFTLLWEWYLKAVADRFDCHWMHSNSIITAECVFVHICISLHPRGNPTSLVSFSWGFLYSCPQAAVYFMYQSVVLNMLTSMVKWLFHCISAITKDQNLEWHHYICLLITMDQILHNNQTQVGESFKFWELTTQLMWSSYGTAYLFTYILSSTKKVVLASMALLSTLVDC